jgi:hypothetical protein
MKNCKKKNLEIHFLSTLIDHSSSDDCGVEILDANKKNVLL